MDKILLSKLLVFGVGALTVVAACTIAKEQSAVLAGAGMALIGWVVPFFRSKAAE